MFVVDHGNSWSHVMDRAETCKDHDFFSHVKKIVVHRSIKKYRRQSKHRRGSIVLAPYNVTVVDRNGILLIRDGSHWTPHLRQAKPTPGCHYDATMMALWTSAIYQDATKTSTGNNSLLVCSTCLRGSWENWNRHNRMMPKLRRTRECVVIPLAANEPSSGVPEPPINVQSVPAEVVVHCEDSTKPRAPPWTVVEKNILTWMNPHHVAFQNNQKKTISSPQHHVIVEMQDRSHVRKFCIHHLPRMR